MHIKFSLGNRAVRDQLGDVAVGTRAILKCALKIRMSVYGYECCLGIEFSGWLL
jgi:hypothetical protein